MKFRLALGPLAILWLTLSFGDAARATDATAAPSAASLLDDLDRDPHKELLADVIRSGRNAAERATRMHVAGDDAHALLAEAVAREWAELGKDLLVTSLAEENVAATLTAILDAGATVERETAAIEALTLRKGRLETALAAASRAADAGVAGDAGGKAPKGSPKGRATPGTKSATGASK